MVVKYSVSTLFSNNVIQGNQVEQMLSYVHMLIQIRTVFLLN